MAQRDKDNQAPGLRNQARVVSALIAVTAWGLVSSYAVADENYVWPLAYKGCLTSTFAEYRPNHFHAGIDLSTNGETGYRVQAVSDGEVYRLRTSPYGYGKAIYLKLSDGRIAVFGHLSDFSPRLRTWVEQEQDREDRYEVDFQLPARSIPVTAGEIIGYSGQTGTGAPHLHFELRDGEERPLNPVLNGFPVHDETPPDIRSVVFTPMEADARVNGSIRPITLPFRWSDSRGVYFVPETVHIEGDVGILVQASDGQTACDRPLGVYRLNLNVNQQVVYQSQFDHFTHEVAHLVGLEFDEETIERGGSRYHRLFNSAANLLPFTITDKEEAGVLQATEDHTRPGETYLEGGLHRVEVLAADANGNHSTAEMGVFTGMLPAIERIQIPSDRDVTVFFDSPMDVRQVVVSRSVNGGRRWDERVARLRGETGQWEATGFASTQAARKPYLVRIDYQSKEGVAAAADYRFVNYDGLPTPEPLIDLGMEYHADAALIRLEVDRAFPYEVEARAVRKDRSVVRPAMRRTSERAFEGILSFPELNSKDAWVEVSVRGRDGAEWSVVEEIRTMKIAAFRGGHLTDREERAHLRVPRRALLRDSYFRVEEASSVPLEEGLTYMSPLYRYDPADALLRDDVEVGIRPFTDIGERKKVSLYRLDVHNRWHYMIRPQQDEDATIWARTRVLTRYALLRDDAPPAVFGVRPAQGAVVPNGAPRLQAKVTDIGSGFETDGIQILLDGRKVIAEWDPERSFVQYSPREPLAAGTHRVTIVATDRAGNQTRKESSFFVSPK